MASRLRSDRRLREAVAGTLGACWLRSPAGRIDLTTNPRLAAIWAGRTIGFEVSRAA
jgi:hypothetical protein